MFAMGIAVLAASTAALFIRYAQGMAPSLVIAGYRLGLAGAILWPLALLWHSDELRSLSQHEIGMAAFSGLFLAAHFGTWVASLEYTTVASSLVLVSMAPLFVGILAPITLKEPLRHNVLLGLLIALFGTLVIGLGDTCAWQGKLVCPSVSELLNAARIHGDLLALLGAITVSGYMLIGRHLRITVPLIPYITVAYSVAAVSLLVAAMLAGQPLWGYPAEAYCYFLLLALVPQLIAHSTYNWTLRYLPVTVVSIMLLGEPVASSLWAYALLGEQPSWLMAGGGMIVLVGVGIASWRTSSRRRERRPGGRAGLPSLQEEGAMQVRCYRCNTSYSLGREEIQFALEALEESGGKHYDARCPRCRQMNRVSLEQLRQAARAAPPPEVPPEEADEAPE
jgi:drug/metabolite transporter (DMT)-like permease